MVAFVTGTGLGLERSSGFVLGGGGSIGDARFGRLGENVTVNAATGNLIINRADEMLIGLGPDSSFSRSYNSLGTLNDDNGDNWQLNVQRRVTVVTGVLNTAGSTVTRIDWDGSDSLYSWDATTGVYICKQGAGAYDSLVLTSNTWTWTDGNTRATETYDKNNGGRITTMKDADGNKLNFTYTGSQLTRVTTKDAEYTDLTWSGNNLTQLVTTLSGGATLTRVRYGYDAFNRLSTVTTDLTPEDNATSDGAAVITTYTYTDDVSRRIASISQTGGARLDIGYDIFDDSVYRVTSLTQTTAAGLTSTTTLGYDIYSNITSITDAQYQTTDFYYTLDGQLSQIVHPSTQVDAPPQIELFGYNANGDVTSVTDAAGNATVYNYDARGNLILQRDAAGNTITRTYGTMNELLTETSYTVADPDGAGTASASQPVTKRFAYDAENHLRFILSPEREVTELIYDAYGRETSSIVYRDNKYGQAAFDALAQTDSVSESTFAAWVSSLTDRSTVERTDTIYDFRGNVSAIKEYSAASAAGVGQSLTTQTNYTYDQFGNLLRTSTNGIPNSEVFTYDGLGRVLSHIGVNNVTTTIAFSDAQNKMVATLANGLVQTSVYNLAGRLISYAEAGSGVTSATTTYKYDNLGHLRMVTDAENRTAYYVYDTAGRKVLDVATNGQVIQYRYDAANRLVSTLRPYNLLLSGEIAKLVDSSGNPVNVSYAGVVDLSGGVPADVRDQWEWRIYDQADRLIEIIDAVGDVTTFVYDGRSNLVRTTSYYGRLSASQISSFKTTPPTALVVPGATAGKDKVSRNFFDSDGRLVGALDGDGFLSRTVYNEAGEKIEDISFATVTNATLQAAGSFADLLSSVGTTSRDRRDRFFYDGRGLLRYSLDTALQPTEYVYDAAEQLLHTTRYAGAIAATSSYSLAYVQAQIASSGLATDANNRMTSSIYDGFGHVAYTIDAGLAVVQYQYDTMGRLTKQTSFAGLSTATTGDYTLSTMQGWASARGSDPANRVTRTVYDATDRVAFTIDAESYVTEYRYDRSDKLVRVIRYADTYAVNDGVTQSSLATLIGATIPATASQTRYGYDALGRLATSYDANDTQTSYAYDVLDRVILKTVASGTTDNALTYYTYDAVGRVASETDAYLVAEATTTLYAYDGLGNLLTRTDGRNFSTTYTYDALGRVLTETDPIDATNQAVTTYTYDAFGNILTTTDPRGYVSYAFYDNLDRQILAIDQEGYATATSYSFAGDVSSVTRYATKVTGAITPGIAPTPAVDAAEDATTSFLYDKVGRLTRATDALSFYEDYTLNAFGDRIAVRNKLGGVTTNVFDRRGLLKSETLPVNSVNAQGTVVAVTNSYEYDGRGNRTKMIEAVGLPEQRTTAYKYDLLDRLVETTGDQIQIVDANLATSTIIPKQTFIYDRRSNLIESDDAAGKRTQYYYDYLNRKTVELDAGGTVRTWTYDANGNVASTRIYADFYAPVTSPGGLASFPTTPYRETTFTYDRMNRVLTASIANIMTGRFDGANYSASTGNVTTRNYYDKSGNIIRQDDELLNSTYYYYDKFGRKVAQVDRQNYLTYYMLDPDGNVTKEERLGTALAATPSVTDSASALRSSVAGLGADRTTVFTYDMAGQRTSETRYWVFPRVIDASGNVTTATDSHTHIYYTFNGLGQVTSKTEATGDVTSYGYDAAGRLQTVTGPGFTDFSGAAVQRVTQNSYDGLNNLIRTVENSLQTTTYAYGAGGRLSSMTDAMNFTHSYSYDALGRVTLDKYTRVKSDGVTSALEARVTIYDAVGRLKTQAAAVFNGTAWASNYWQYMSYNGYGELTKRGGNGMWQEAFAYDGAGRLVRSTGGDGVVKLFVYDAAGQQTMAFSPTGSALPAGYDWQTLTAAQALALTGNGGTAVAGIAATMSIYDKRGQATETRELNRETTAIGSAYATLIHKQSYNAFGEVLSETDARGYTTTYAYDNRGKLYTKTMPVISVTAENGAITTVNPIEYYYYDASGRLIITRDANGNSTKRILLAGTGYGGDDALAVKEFHADGGVVANGYDALLNLRKTTNEVGQAASYTYDLLGRVTQVTHPLRTGGVQLSDYYAYDGLGQRVAHWNSQFGATVKERTDYNQQGQVSMQTDLAGHATYYGYSWSSAKTTNGLGTFGGWTKQTQNVAGLISSEVTDYFGRTIDKVDFGGIDYNYSFDLAGQLTQRTNSAGENINYSYFNTGQLAVVNAAVFIGDYQTNATTVNYNRSTSTNYRYDANGNRIYEETWITISDPDLLGDHGLTTTTTMRDQNSSITYDALNRMTAYTDSGENGGNPVTIAYEYDLNSNVRRMAATYRDVKDGTAGTQEYWYKYDNMNRFVTTKGTLNGARGSGTIVRGASGTDITYNATGQRMSATDAGDRKDFSYTEDGYLSTVKIGGIVRATYGRDTIGRATNYAEYQGDGTTLSYSRQSTYDAGGLTTDDVVQQRQSNGTMLTTTTHYDYTLNTSASGSLTSGAGGSRIAFGTGGAYQGVVTHTRSVRSSDNAVSETEYFYNWRGEALKRHTGNFPFASNTPYVTDYEYDSTGYLIGVEFNNSSSGHVDYVNTPDGKVLGSWRWAAGYGGYAYGFHYFANGVHIGAVGNDGAPETDYTTALAERANPPAGNNLFRYGTAVSYADFDQSFEPVNPTSQGPVNTTYTVQDGDTLASIALTQWGDASLWYLIADANGLSGGETLAAGRILSIPAKVTNVHNSASTFKVYDPNKAFGSTDPIQPAPKHRGCGILGTVLMVVVAAVVTYFTAGALLEAYGPIVAGAIGGAAGSVASQGVGLATGIQDKFSWKAVGIAAISGAIGGGLGKVPGLNGGFIQDVARGAIANAATQGVSVATGLQRKFDWTGVAVGAAASGAMGLVGRDVFHRAPNQLNTGQQLATGMAGAIAGAATRSLIDGTDFGDNIMAALPDVIGNTIGNLAADRLSRIGDPKLAYDKSVFEDDGAVTGGGPRGMANDSFEFNPNAGLSYVQYRPVGPRGGIGGNGGPSLYDPMTLQQAAGPLVNTGAGPVLSLADGLFDLTGPANQLMGDLYQAQRNVLVNQLEQLDPNWSYASLGAPGTTQGRLNDLNDLRTQRAAMIYSQTGETGPLQVETLRTLQRFVDDGYALGVQRYDSGLLPSRLNRNEAIGNFVDRYARDNIKLWYNQYGISTAADQPIRVNNRAYAADGSYRLPDVRVGSAAFDMTLSLKTAAMPQVRGFFNASFRPNSVTIVRPTALGGSYIIPRTGH